MILIVAFPAAVKVLDHGILIDNLSVYFFYVFVATEDFISLKNKS